MKSICVVLTILAVVQFAQPKASAQTPTERSKVVQQSLFGCPDRLAVVEYDPNRDEIDITIVPVTEVLQEYERLKAKTNRDEHEHRRYVALVIAIATFRAGARSN